MQSGPLAGKRVLDIGHYIAGPWCGRLLASLGADVIKIEYPGGDPLRTQEPTITRSDGSKVNATFVYVNGGKTSISLNLKSAAGKELFLGLARCADLIVENFSPGVLSGLGVGFDVIAGTNPQCCLVSISNFGQTGPKRDYKATELVLYAGGGLMSISGIQGKEPLKHGLFTQAQFAAGTVAAFAAIAGLSARRITGRGHWVEVAINEVLTSELVAGLSYYAYSGAVQGRQKIEQVNIDGRVGLIQARDGLVHPSLGTADGKDAWESLSAMLEAPELVREEFLTHAQRSMHAEKLAGMLANAVADKPKRELFHRANTWRLPWGMSQELGELLKCPQLQARGFFIDSDDGPVAGIPCKSSQVGQSSQHSDEVAAAPRPGHGNELVYGRLLDLSPSKLAALRAEGVI